MYSYRHNPWTQDNRVVTTGVGLGGGGKGGKRRDICNSVIDKQERLWWRTPASFPPEQKLRQEFQTSLNLSGDLKTECGQGNMDTSTFANSGLNRNVSP